MLEGPPADFGRYRLIEKLGMGGFAEVFLAESAGPAGFTKRVVVKRLLPELVGHPEISARFLEEARLSALLAHPNVVQVFELGEVEGVCYIAMEYIRGADLRKIERTLRDGDAEVPIGIAAAIAAAVCRALEHAHTLCVDGVQMCVVHRDVSASNVLLSVGGDVKLIDFGIARAYALARERITQRGTTVRGKLVYASPEVVLGLPMTPGSDIFSLGCLLYEALTGVRPFERSTELATEAAITHEVAVPPSRLRAAVPEALDEIVMRALARDRAARFETAAQMARALESFVGVRGQRIGTPQIAAFVVGALDEESALSVTGTVASPVDEDPDEPPTTVQGEPPEPPTTVERPRRSGNETGPVPSPAPKTPPDAPPSQVIDRTLTLTLFSARLATRIPNPVAFLLIALLGLGLGGICVGAWWPDAPQRRRPAPLAAALRPPDPRWARAVLAAAPEQSPPPRPVSQRPAEVQSPVPSAPTQTPTERKVTGRLRLVSYPRGWVEIDGVRVADRTPLLNYSLEAGAHRIRVVNERLHRSATLSVRIRARRTVAVDVRLRPMGDR